MTTVTHMCGHTQDTNLDVMAARLVKQGKRTVEWAAKFMMEQTAWLEGHICPQCYRRLKGL